MKKSLILFCISIAVITVLCSCGSRNSNEQPEKAEKPNVSQAKLAVENDNYDQKIVSLRNALHNTENWHKKKKLFSELIDIFIQAEKIQEARNVFLIALEKSPCMALPAHNIIMESLEKKGKEQQLTQWCEELLKSRLPSQLKTKAVIKRDDILISTGRFYAILDSIQNYKDNLTPGQFQEIMEHIYSRLLALADQNLLDRLDEFTEKKFPHHAGLSELRVYTEVAMLAQKNDNIKYAAESLENQFWSLSDSYLHKAVKILLDKAKKQGEKNISEQICERVFEHPGYIPLTEKAAAKHWLMLATDEGDAKALARRLGVIAEQNLGASCMHKLLSIHCHTLLRLDNTEAIDKVIAIGAKLLKEAQDKREADELRWILFDMNCYVQNFDEALELLESIKTAKAERVELLKNKILAHRAMEEKDTDEAVRRFRKFMDDVKKDGKRQFDPIKKEFIPTSSILGLNALRIADILESAGRNAEAKKAYKEAMEYYNKALTRLPSDSGHRKEIQAKLVTINKNINK